MTPAQIIHQVRQLSTYCAANESRTDDTGRTLASYRRILESTERKLTKALKRERPPP